MKKTDEIIDIADNYLLHTYNRFGIVLERGEGVRLYDIEGKSYLDFAAGIAVYALGYGNERVNKAIKDQLDKLSHTSNLFYNEPSALASKAICEATGMDRVFFTNSGTEAIEGAIKTALKYSWNKEERDDYEIIAMNGSFHGRSMGSLSVTGNRHYREPFGPGIGHIKFAEYNDLDSVKALISEKTSAIILETLQGEGGIHVAHAAFIEGIRRLCDENGILMILDEIQCGMGRTGTMFAYERYGISPDIMTVAKAVGGGLPVGGFLMKESVAESSMVPGDHGSTYGGNPLCTAAITAVLKEYKDKDIVSHVREIAPYLEKRLDEIKSRHDDITDRRGLGCMQGLEFNHPVGDIIKKCQDAGLILITAGANVIRLVPPLVIGKEDIDQMYQILDSCI